MEKLNPYSAVLREIRKKTQGTKKKISKEEKKATRARSHVAKARINATMAKVGEYTEECVDTYKDQVRQMHV